MEDHYQPPKAAVVADSAADPSDFGEIMTDHDNRAAFRRAFATLIDYPVMFSFLLIPDLVFGNAAYRETIFLWLALAIAYFPAMEAWTGTTVGKFIARIRVVDEHGNNPTFKQGGIRMVLRLLEVNPFLFGGLPAFAVVLGSDRAQRLGDMAAGTYVTRMDVVEDFHARQGRSRARGGVSG